MTNFPLDSITDLLMNWEPMKDSHTIAHVTTSFKRGNETIRFASPYFTLAISEDVTDDMLRNIQDNDDEDRLVFYRNRKGWWPSRVVILERPTEEELLIMRMRGTIYEFHSMFYRMKGNRLHRTMYLTGVYGEDNTETLKSWENRCGHGTL